MLPIAILRIAGQGVFVLQAHIEEIKTKSESWPVWTTAPRSSGSKLQYVNSPRSLFMAHATEERTQNQQRNQPQNQPGQTSQQNQGNRNQGSQEGANQNSQNQNSQNQGSQNQDSHTKDAQMKGNQNLEQKSGDDRLRDQHPEHEQKSPPVAAHR